MPMTRRSSFDFDQHDLNVSSRSDFVRSLDDLGSVLGFIEDEEGTFEKDFRAKPLSRITLKKRNKVAPAANSGSFHRNVKVEPKDKRQPSFYDYPCGAIDINSRRSSEFDPFTTDWRRIMNEKLDARNNLFLKFKDMEKENPEREEEQPGYINQILELEARMRNYSKANKKKFWLTVVGFIILVTALICSIVIAVIKINESHGQNKRRDPCRQNYRDLYAYADIEAISHCTVLKQLSLMNCNGLRDDGELLKDGSSRGNTEKRFFFPNLKEIEKLEISNCGNVDLPELTTVDQFSIMNGYIDTFSAPKLESIGIWIRLTNVSFSDEARVDFSSLSFANQLLLNNVTWKEVAFPKLNNSALVSIVGSEIANISFPYLHKVSGPILLSDLTPYRIFTRSSSVSSESLSIRSTNFTNKVDRRRKDANSCSKRENENSIPSLPIGISLNRLQSAGTISLFRSSRVKEFNLESLLMVREFNLELVYFEKPVMKEEVACPVKAKSLRSCNSLSIHETYYLGYLDFDDLGSLYRIEVNFNVHFHRLDIASKPILLSMDGIPDIEESGELDESISESEIFERTQTECFLLSVTVNRNAHLKDLNLGKITEVSVLQIFVNPRLRAVDLSYLQRSEAIVLANNQELREVDVSSVQDSSIIVIGNENLEYLDFPSLEESDIIVIAKNHLRSVNAPILKTLKIKSWKLLSANVLWALSFTKFDQSEIVSTIWCSDERNLETLNFPQVSQLFNIGLWDLRIETLNLSSVQSANELYLGNLNQTKTIDLASLTHVNHLTLLNARKLTNIQLPSLETLGFSLYVHMNTLLKTFDVPLFQGFNLTFYEERLNTTLLEAANLRFTGNTALCLDPIFGAKLEQNKMDISLCLIDNIVKVYGLDGYRFLPEEERTSNINCSVNLTAQCCHDLFLDKAKVCKKTQSLQY